MIQKLLGGNTLAEGEAERLMHAILEGRASEVQAGALWAVLGQRRATMAETVGFARATREKALCLAPPAGIVVGMGGSGDAGAERFDTTTLAALVLASAGVRVAKLGNRSTSGRVGSADLLQALGVRIALPLPDLLDCLRHTGFAFLDVHRHHPTLKHVLKPRQPLGVRAVCDQLASLANPASATHHLQGVDAAESAPILAEAFLQLGCKAALVVHGEDGVAPISPTGPTTVVELRQGRLDRFTWQPEDAGLKRRRLQELTGGDLHWSRQIARGVLQGEPGAYFDAVALNAGAALYGAGASKDLWTGTQDARLLLQSGQVRRKLDEIVAFTQPRSSRESG